MIGAFARMIGGRGRLVSYEQTGDQSFAVQSVNDAGEGDVRETHDAPPAAFAEPIPHEGGTVYLVPVLEAFREWFRKWRAGEADEAGTLPRTSDNA